MSRFSLDLVSNAGVLITEDYSKNVPSVHLQKDGTISKVLPSYVFLSIGSAWKSK